MTTHNIAFWRSLRALAHPVSIGAVILLLLNDHVLRVEWPSWWTGKLGDFSWLVFFPFVLAVPFALIIPPRLKYQQEVVAGLGFGLTALMFISMKTIPAVMSAGLWILGQITGGPFTLRVDPTDLLALPGLLIGWWVWRQATQPAPASRGWAILTLGALATIATSPPAPRGLYDLSQNDDGSISVIDIGGAEYISTDGGFSWHKNESYDTDVIQSPQPAQYIPWQISDPADPDIIYRFTSDDTIERSDDGGLTWEVELDLAVTEAQRIYNRQIIGRHDSPADAVIDQQYGTVVVAMGIEGILTRTQTGDWVWVSIGDPAVDSYRYYTHRSDVRTLAEITTLLMIQLWLAAGLIPLVPGLLAYRTGAASVWRILNGVLSAGMWVVAVVFSPIAFDPFTRGIFFIYMLVYAVSSIIFGIIGLNVFRDRFQTIPNPVWQCALASPVLFIVPFVLWSQAIIITDLIAATIIACVLVVGVFIWGVWHVGKRSGPITEPLG